jgi:hypothetical protein
MTIKNIVVKGSPKGKGRMQRGTLVILGSRNIIRRWPERYVKKYLIIERVYYVWIKIQLLLLKFCQELKQHCFKTKVFHIENCPR